MKIFYLIPFLLISLVLSNRSFAQNENNMWTFGRGHGINFNTSPPSLFRNEINTAEGCASVCDSSGKLLFYSNGDEVWDATNTRMPNGFDLKADTIDFSCTQGVAIAPVIGFPNLYYLFSLEAHLRGTNTLRYSLIDMSLNGGKGDIVATKKNIVLDSVILSEKMIVAPACNGVWLIVHAADSPVFYSYKINSPLGIAKSPVISRTSGISFDDSYMIGEIKLSPDFKKIAMGNYTTKGVGIGPQFRVELFDFDIATGVISGYNLIDSSFGANYAYSVEFSPDNSKFYLADFLNVYQFDLSLLSSSLAAVVASKTIVGDGTEDAEIPTTDPDSFLRSGILRLAPDGKIYVSNALSFTPQARINSPNKLGVACGFVISEPSLFKSYMLSGIGGGYYLGLGNNFVKPISATGAIICKRFDTSICNGSSVSYTANPLNQFIIWNDGDTSRTRTFSNAGKFWRKSERDCQVFIDSFNISVRAEDTSYSVTDTTVCFQQQVTVQTKTAYSTYLWSDGTTNRSNIFNSTGTKWVYARNNNECKLRIDSFKVTLTNFNLILPDASLCTQKAVTLNAQTNNASSYLWNDGSTADSLLVNRSGSYWVEVAVGNCKKRDTATVIDAAFIVNLGADRQICEGQSITLQNPIQGASYRWQDGSSSSSLLVSGAGIYSLQVAKDGCIGADTVLISVRNCNCFNIANAFTPNGDGRNDVFKPILNCPSTNYSFIIVNRYGEIIFSTTNTTSAWDGRINNSEQEVGVYYYLIKVKFFNNDKEELYKGDVSLIR